MATWNDSFETGFDGRREVDYTYNIAVDGYGRAAVATLEVERVVMEDGQVERSVTRHRISAKDLVELIQKHGTPLP